MTLIEEGARDDPDRVREVDDPGVGKLADAIGDLEHHRHGAQRLREPTGAGRLLPDAATRQRERLVAQPRVLSAYPDLHEHEVRVRDRSIEIIGDVDRAAIALPLEHAHRQAADDTAPFGVDVVQHELRDLEA